MHAYRTEIMPEARLEEGARPWIERLPGRTEHFEHEAGHFVADDIGRSGLPGLQRCHPLLPIWVSHADHLLRNVLGLVLERIVNPADREVRVCGTRKQGCRKPGWRMRSVRPVRRKYWDLGEIRWHDRCLLDPSFSLLLALIAAWMRSLGRVDGHLRRAERARKA
jgi:hypothetical protein